MDPVAAASAAHPHIERLGVERYRTDLPELADLIEAHRYFGIYAVGRTAAAGAGPLETHALMALFPEGLVRKAFEWVPPDRLEEVRDRYMAACDDAGDRAFADLPDAPELADRLEHLVDVSGMAGRPLAAAWAQLPRPDGTGARIERAATVLREHRGGGHLAALAVHDLLGVEALLLTAAWRGDDDPEAYARSRGFRDEAIDRGWDALRDTGWVDAGHAITADGRAVRDDVEDVTDVLDARAWDRLSEEDRTRTLALLEATAPDG